MPIEGLGQGAFRVRDGSIVVRKDWKILLVDTSAWWTLQLGGHFSLVDTSGLHGKLGLPPSSRSEVALDAAAVILGCWNGDRSM